MKLICSKLFFLSDELLCIYINDIKWVSSFNHSNDEIIAKSLPWRCTFPSRCHSSRLCTPAPVRPTMLSTTPPSGCRVWEDWEDGQRFGVGQRSTLLVTAFCLQNRVTHCYPSWSMLIPDFRVVMCTHQKKTHAAAMNGFLSPPTESTLAVFCGRFGRQKHAGGGNCPHEPGMFAALQQPEPHHKGSRMVKGIMGSGDGQRIRNMPQHCSTCSTLDGRQQDLNDVHLTPVSSPKAFTIRSTHHQSTTGSTTAQASAPHPPSRAPAPTGVPPDWSSAKRGSRWPVTPVPCAPLGSSSALQRASDHTWNGLGSVRCWWVLIKIQNYCWKFISCCISRLSVAVFPEKYQIRSQKING